MPTAQTISVEALRPAAMQSRPVRVDKVFDDPDTVIDLIRARAPYVNLAEYHHMQDTLGGVNTRPWFRSHFEDALFLDNARWMRAAREAFDAEIVRPFKCILNLNGPMGIGGVHVDLPVYRGFSAPAVPVWLLMNMTYSGLFQAWMVPIASGLCWFHRGTGGAFEYWPDGTDASPHVEAPPLWNCGVMSDNEFMWHGVAPIGTDAERAAIAGTLQASDRLHAADDGGWEIRDDARVVARLAAPQLRISLLWKARVFRNADHLASFEDRGMDLTLDQVTDSYLEDLAAKGVTARRPVDPLTDADWRQTLEGTYRAAFS